MLLHQWARMRVSHSRGVIAILALAIGLGAGLVSQSIEPVARTYAQSPEFFIWGFLGRNTALCCNGGLLEVTTFVDVVPGAELTNRQIGPNVNLTIENTDFTAFFADTGGKTTTCFAYCEKAILVRY